MAASSGCLQHRKDIHRWMMSQKQSDGVVLGAVVIVMVIMSIVSGGVGGDALWRRKMDRKGRGWGGGVLGR